MSKIKIAIFVEGQTEGILVKKIISLIPYPIPYYLRYWENKPPTHSAPENPTYCVGNPEANLVFDIFDIEGDGNIVASLLKYKDKPIEHQAIIVLIDVYNPNDNSVKGKIRKEWVYPENVKRKKITTLDVIHTTLKNTEVLDKLKLCFAVMEIEAWILGMWSIFERIDARLTETKLKEILGVKSFPNPETEYVHPAAKVKTIYEEIGKTYKKEINEIKNLCNKIEPEDLQALYDSDRCASFNEFYDVLTGVIKAEP